MLRRERRRRTRERNLREVVWGRVVEESEKRVKIGARREQARKSLEAALMAPWRREVKVVEKESKTRRGREGKRGAEKEARQKLRRRR